MKKEIRIMRQAAKEEIFLGAMIIMFITIASCLTGCAETQKRSNITAMTIDQGLMIDTIPPGWAMARNADVKDVMVYKMNRINFDGDGFIAFANVWCVPFDERESLKETVIPIIIRQQKEKTPDAKPYGPYTRSREEGGGYALDFLFPTQNLRIYYRVRRVEDDHVVIMRVQFLGEPDIFWPIMPEIDRIAAGMKFIPLSK